MRKILSVSVLLVSILSFGQITKDSSTYYNFNSHPLFGNIKSTPISYKDLELYKNLLTNTELIKKWDLDYKLLHTYTNDFTYIELPFHLKYNFSEKGTLLFGPKLDFILDYNQTGFPINKLGVSFEIGVHYNFTENIFTELKYTHRFTEQLNNSVLKTYGKEMQTIKLDVGIKF